MENTSPKVPNTSPPQPFKVITKKNFLQLGMDFKSQGNMAIGLSIINALQIQMKSKYYQIDADPTLYTSQPQPDKQTIVQRCLKCYEKNATLLEKVLKLKEELILRMYSKRTLSKINQEKLGEILAEIRYSKMKIREQFYHLNAKKERMQQPKHSPSPSSSREGQEFNMDEQDYLTLQLGMQTLGRQSYQLKVQLQAYISSKSSSPPSKVSKK